MHICKKPAKWLNIPYLFSHKYFAPPLDVLSYGRDMVKLYDSIFINNFSHRI